MERPGATVWEWKYKCKDIIKERERDNYEKKQTRQYEEREDHHGGVLGLCADCLDNDRALHEGAGRKAAK